MSTYNCKPEFMKALAPCLAQLLCNLMTYLVLGVTTQKVKTQVSSSEKIFLCGLWAWLL